MKRQNLQLCAVLGMVVTLIGAGIWQDGFAKLSHSSLVVTSAIPSPEPALKATVSADSIAAARAAASKSSGDSKNQVITAKHKKLVQVPPVLNGTANSIPSASATNSSLPSDAHTLQAQRHEQRVLSIHSFLEAHNIADAKVRDVVIERLLAQEAARRELQTQGRQLFPVLGRKGMPPATEVRTNQQLEAYSQAVRDFQEKRRQSEAILEEKTRFSKNPRMRALLTVMGLVGEGPAILPL